MKTNLQFLMILLLLVFSSKVWAQPDDGPEGREEKIETLKRAFIAEKLELTVKESEKFWPVFNEYNDKKKDIRNSLRELSRALEDNENPTDKQVQETASAIAQKRIDDANLDTLFVNDVLPILGSKKTARLLGLEEEFRRELMDKLKERRGDGPPPPHRPTH